MSATSEATPSTIRDCNGCTLCCKVMEIPELVKPPGVWCSHCMIAKGCAIYNARPPNCRKFNCAYLLDPTLDERWKPSTAKFCIVVDREQRMLAALVDAQQPDAWKREPYYSQFKAWSKAALASNGQMLILVGQRCIAVLPDRDVDLGVVAADEKVIVQASGAASPRAEAYKLHKDDPGLVAGRPLPPTNR